MRTLAEDAREREAKARDTENKTEERAGQTQRVAAKRLVTRCGDGKKRGERKWQ